MKGRLLLGLAALVLGIAGWVFQQDHNTEPVRKTEVPGISGVPEKVFQVLEYVEKYDQAPEGYVGGRRFNNYEKRLPVLNKKGEKIQYKEWDVNPKEPHKNRGPERLVTGSGKTAWYTPDHYQNFIKIK